MGKIMFSSHQEEYRSQFVLAFKALSQDKLALIGVFIIFFIVAISAITPWISPYSPTESNFETGRLMPIGTPGHILGTDGQSRDILSRLLWGGRVSIPIAVLPVIFSAFAFIHSFFGSPLNEQETIRTS